jgi:hypothetical protein
MVAKKSVFFVVVLLVQFKLIGQTIHPANTPAFLQNEVASIKITIAPANLAMLLGPDSLEANFEYPATFIYQSATISDTVYNVGFRLRGNTSRYSAKKSFKVAFNSFTQGMKWNNLEKMNLNGEHNDVSILRSYLSAQMLVQAGVVAPRTSYVKLYVNNEYKGLYINVEHIDEQFLKQRFPLNNYGTLIKSGYGANLKNLGTNEANYSPFYELKQGNNLQSLIQFIAVLNTNSSNFPCAIQAVFDVDSYLKTLAIEILTGHWDGYAFNKNNFYLYQRPSDGKFMFIEYDMDNTFGVDWVNINWTNRNIYSWGNTTDPRPLYSKLMAVPYFKDRFTYYVDLFTSSFFTTSTIVSLAQQKQALIESAALDDDYKGYDYNFSNFDFLEAITTAWGGHIDFSIEDYVQLRTMSATQQLLPFQNLQNPCSLGIESLSIEPFEADYATTLIGQKIPIETTNQVIILWDKFGNSQKKYMFE